MSDRPCRFIKFHECVLLDDGTKRQMEVNGQGAHLHFVIARKTLDANPRVRDLIDAFEDHTIVEPGKELYVYKRMGFWSVWMRDSEKK